MNSFHVDCPIHYSQWRNLINRCQNNRHAKGGKYGFQFLGRLGKSFRRGPSETFV